MISSLFAEAVGRGGDGSFPRASHKENKNKPTKATR